MKKNKKIINCILILLVTVLIMQFVIATEISDETTTVLSVTGIVRCDTSAENYGIRWIDGRQIPINYPPTIGDGANCFNPDPNAEDKSCCPHNMICLPVEGSGGTGACNYTIANSCIDITNPAQCNYASPSFAEYFYNRIMYNSGEHCRTTTPSWWEGAKFCFNESTCRCMWNGTSCIGALNYTKKCDLIATQGYGECQNSVSNITDNCEAEGFYVYEIISRWEDYGSGSLPIDCDEEAVIESRVACGTVAKLGFFGIFNIICVIISLIIIYGLSSFKKRPRRKLK